MSEQTYFFEIVSDPLTADFTLRIPEVLFFPPHVQNITIPVKIVGDKEIEMTEQFQLSIHRSGGAPFEVDGSHSQTTIYIIDNDKGEFFYFENESISYCNSSIYFPY